MAPSFRVKIANFLSFFCLKISKKDLDIKEIGVNLAYVAIMFLYKDVHTAHKPT